MKRVAVTRPRKFLPDTVSLLQARGLEAVPVPMMEMIPRHDGALEGFFDRLAAGEVDTVIITSQNGVQFIYDRSVDPAMLTKQLNSVEVIGIGPKTNSALTDRGINHIQMPATFSSEGIVQDFCAKLKGRRVEVLRSDHGNPLLISGLELGGAKVREIIVYDILPLSGEEQAGFVREALTGSIDAYTFTSTMTARSLLMIGESMGVLDELKKEINAKKVAVIGHPTADFLKKSGIRVDVVPERFTFEDMVDALLKVL